MIKTKKKKHKPSSVGLVKKGIRASGETTSDIVAFFQNVALSWHFARLDGETNRNHFIASMCSNISLRATCSGIAKICKQIRITPENAALLFDMFYYNAFGKLPVNRADSALTREQLERFDKGDFNVAAR